MSDGSNHSSVSRSVSLALPDRQTDRQQWRAIQTHGPTGERKLTLALRAVSRASERQKTAACWRLHYRRTRKVALMTLRL